jgi:NADH-quinone oxidoreductase subunit M
VFLSFDLFLLFVFYEIVVIPKYFLIAIWGSTRREYAAMKLVLYSFIGSAMVLVGLIAAYVVSGSHSMSLGDLAGYHYLAALPDVGVPAGLRRLRYPRRSLAFPHLGADRPRGRADSRFHAARRRGHETGRLRLPARRHDAVPSRPRPWGFHVLGLGSWRDVFAVLAVIGILYGALVALVQKDFKFVIGYSSISHMGFILLGLMTLNQIGISGAIVQMVSHGILAGLLFGVVGRMVYSRTHTRDLPALAPMHLSKLLPFAAFTFVIAGMASMGLPGFSGFAAELMILIGVWHSYPDTDCLCRHWADCGSRLYLAGDATGLLLRRKLTGR